MKFIIKFNNGQDITFNNPDQFLFFIDNLSDCDFDRLSIFFVHKKVNNGQPIQLTNFNDIQQAVRLADL